MFPFRNEHKEKPHPKITIRLNWGCQKGRNYVHLALRHFQYCYSRQTIQRLLSMQKLSSISKR